MVWVGKAIKWRIWTNGSDNKNVANGTGKGEEEEERVMENGLLLTLSCTPQPTSLFFQLNTTTTTTPHFRFTSPQLRFSFTLTRYSKWDPNAETFRPRNFSFNDQEEDDEEEQKRGWWSNNFQMRKKKSRNFFEQVVDSIWILKVFKSYGWLLPTIIISLLLATGPKAFITTLTLSLGLSALSLAVEKLQEKTQRKPKRKKRVRRKRFYSDATSVGMNEEEQAEDQETRNKEMGEFWVGSNNGSVSKGSEVDSNFAGWDWDDLNGAGYVRRKSQFTGGSQMRRKDKLSGSGRNSEMPLLLRLLIAVFPFVSSWAEFW